MSASPPQKSADLSRFVSDHLPQAEWAVEGAFRFDQHLITLLSFLSQYYAPRRVSRVFGAPPCVWSLDLYGSRKAMGLSVCRSVMEAWAQFNTGVVLVFDNPLVSAEALEDSLGHRLVQLLFTAECNPTGRNAVCVASESLARILRERYPQIPLICHQNRLIMSVAKRTPAFYEKLAEEFQEVILHPRDAVNPAFVSGLRHAQKYTAVLNDPTPRNYAVRRELLQMTAEQRCRPWDAALVEAKDALATRTGLFDVGNASILTAAEEAALYTAGVRSFLLQSFMFRNELTLFWDMFHHLFRTTPEHSNEVALIVSAAMANIRDLEDEPPSGLKIFRFTDN